MSQDHRSGEGEESLARFVASAFRSIWSVELLVLVRSRPDHDWSREELITGLRASEQVLARSIEDLAATDLVRLDDGGIRYSPGSSALEGTVADVVRLYATRPAQVRRLVVGGQDQLTRFADAFRWRGDK